jgi:hypothetical protein
MAMAIMIKKGIQQKITVAERMMSIIFFPKQNLQGSDKIFAFKRWVKLLLLLFFIF